MRPALSCVSFLFVTVLSASAIAALPVQELAAGARASVVHLSIRDSGGNEESSGSGFVISEDGKVATNFHVVDGARRMTAVFADGKQVAVAGAWAFDPDADLAILQLDSGKYRPLPLAPKLPAQGAELVVIGSPRGLEGSVSTGILSAFREKGTATPGEPPRPSWKLQISAPVSPGSSGSPVLDADGRVFGVAVGVNRSGQSLNFAVPVDLLRGLALSSAPVPLSDVRGGRSVRENLLISAGFVAALVLTWVIVDFRSRRRKRKREKRPLADYGL